MLSWIAPLSYRVQIIKINIKSKTCVSKSDAQHYKFLPMNFNIQIAPLLYIVYWYANFLLILEWAWCLWWCNNSFNFFRSIEGSIILYHTVGSLICYLMNWLGNMLYKYLTCWEIIWNHAISQKLTKYKAP